jgi:hypothetical protein
MRPTDKEIKRRLAEQSNEQLEALTWIAQLYDLRILNMIYQELDKRRAVGE